MASVIPTNAPRSQLHGVVLALFVACGFATNSALARIAYEAGSNALSVLTVRTTVALLVLATLLKLRRVSARLVPVRRLQALALGVLLALYSYGLLGSIQYVPLAVGLVTFYTYPLMTAFASAALGRERLEPLTLVALLTALYGLTLVLDLRGAPANIVGIAHALGAAVCFCALLLLSDRVREGNDSRPVTLHMLVTGVAVYAIACLVTGLFAVPTTPLGWLAFIGCPVFFSAAFIVLFEAVRMAGPMRAAVVLNVEPVMSALLGYLLLSQQLSGWQVIGMSLVVGAVIAARLSTLTHVGASCDDRRALWIVSIGLILLLAAFATAH